MQSLESILNSIQISQKKYFAPEPEPENQTELVDEPEENFSSSDDDENIFSEDFYAKTIEQLMPKFRCDPTTIEKNLSKLRRIKRDFRTKKEIKQKRRKKKFRRKI